MVEGDFAAECEAYAGAGIGGLCVEALKDLKYLAGILLAEANAIVGNGYLVVAELWVEIVGGEDGT